MKKLLLVLSLLSLLLTGCQSSSDYIHGKLDKREEDRVQQEEYSNEAKGSNIWWNSRYDTRSTNKHLNNDQFGFTR